MSAWTKLRNKVTRPLDELGKKIDDHKKEIAAAAAAALAAGGFGVIAGVATYVKFRYTGKSATTGAGNLTGITYISAPAAFNKDHVVAASALTGDLYYDPLAGYAVFVII